MKYSTITITIFLLIIMIGFDLSSCRLDSRMNFTQIATELGYPVQEYDVITQDGYILKLFHIPGNRTKPILLMHGIIDSADTFIIRRNTSLAAALANAGYDVWIGNSRGNRYSRRHRYLNPNIDKEFWNYSFHEIGYYDLPAMVDFVLDSTGEESLSAIGHSQGNSIFLVLGATRPDYNKKIRVLVSLSPICFLNNLNNTVLRLLHSMPAIDQFYTLIGEEEFLGDNTISMRIFRNICGSKKSYGLCAHGVIFRLAGSDPDELEPDFFPTVIAYYPTGTSKKNAVHLSQVGIRRTFAKYDYGWRNMAVYNLSQPPDYDLMKVTMKIALLAGRNDKLSTLEDVKLLKSKLPNVVSFTVLKHEKFNHVDAIWGRNMREYLFPTVFEILSEHG